ncbi:hypothetical protein [Nostoc sp. CMAA1605]|uniref:hypothetical protein n=1 Tax=Nostoc sp. CMAA1605 TaxID=2055159 RepID=UPI001F306D45|nr:hypothetical protein [Nostoc sp. CMAA1605]
MGHGALGMGHWAWNKGRKPIINKCYTSHSLLTTQHSPLSTHHSALTTQHSLPSPFL